MATNTTFTESFTCEPFISLKTKEGIYPNLTLCYSLEKVESSNFEGFNKAVEQKIASPYVIFPQSNDSKILEDLLKKNGYRAIDQWISMQIATDGYSEVKDSDLTVVRVENEVQLQQWLQIVSATLFNSRALNSALFNHLTNRPGINLWLGHVQNTPICTSLTFQKENTFGVYMVSTLADVQGVGYGKKMVQKAIIHAQSHGLEDVVLQSTRLGINLYRNTGFKELEKHIIYWKTGKEFI